MSNIKSINGATQEEIEFWERTYVALSNSGRNMPAGDVAWLATQALYDRRATFPQTGPIEPVTAPNDTLPPAALFDSKELKELLESASRLMFEFHAAINNALHQYDPYYNPTYARTVADMGHSLNAMALKLSKEGK